MLKASKHAKLYRELKKELITLNPGDKIPSIRNIMLGYSVSQATVTKSISRLQDESLLKKSLGLGTFVTEEVLKYKKNAAPIILVATPRWNSAWYVGVERHFELAQKKYDFSTEFIHYDWQDGIPQKLPDRKADGLIVIPSGKITQQQLTQLEDFKLPFVIFDRPVESHSVNFVCSDDQFSGALAADHLIKLGHKKLALIISEPKVAPVTGRIAGFEQYCELQDAGLEIIDCNINSGDRAIAKVYKTLKARLKQSSPDYTGIFVTSESAALGVYKAFYEKGMSIPRDISIVGVDDQADSDFYYPALTTISSNLNKLVNAASKILLSKIYGAQNNNSLQQKIKSEIIIRKSTCKILN
jgi:DNA-binding LacI/PurR family transcriptional regulator